MKIFNFYIIDFSCYQNLDIKSDMLEHCKVYPLDCNDIEEAKKMLEDNQVLVETKRTLDNSLIKKLKFSDKK
jgi:hypothetical protein